MPVIRVACHEAGSVMTVEPPMWMLIDTDTQERTYEVNPNYVPPDPPSEEEMLQWEIDDLEQQIKSLKKDLEVARARKESKKRVKDAY